MLYFIVFAGLTIVAVAALLYFKYPGSVSERTAERMAFGGILLVLVAVVVGLLLTPASKSPEAKKFKQSLRPFEQKGAFKPEEVWPPTYGNSTPEPPQHERAVVEPANKDAVSDPAAVPIGGEPDPDPPPANPMRVILEPLGENIAPGIVFAHGRVEGGAELPLSMVNGFLSTNGSDVWVLNEGTLEPPSGFRIHLNLEPNARYALKVKATDRVGAYIEAGPFEFSTGPAQ
ncbi:MAG: hypothetical protein Q8L35_08440 [Actinomycetota bacterium]|nr:hypothetical protein [Actinomycetota bacterium]